MIEIILAAGLIGAVGGAIGVLISRLFPERARPIVIGMAAVIAIGLTGPVKSFIDQQTMTPDRFERIAMGALEFRSKGVHRIMLLYKEHEPDLYRSIMEKASAAFKSGKGKDGMANIIRTEVANYTASRTKELSDEGILQLTDLISRQLGQLGVEGEDSICLKMLREEQLGAVRWSDEMVDLEYELARRVVMDPGGSGEKVLPQMAEQVVNTAVQELMNSHGQEKVVAVFDAVAKGGDAPEGTCVIFAEYFKLLKEAAGPQPAPALRTILTSEP